ncbi:ribosomal L1 domain-containing protein CG13096-like [Drosophila serrata]|uniref:ribosomal L1 domain-containing protein CG13096-like n=1 Tax=Drosophila serrata TaxID=7274 RepID=UPI000A1D36E8|nr:ribosomal L1 domain-containing protein CG13096-like [Drosophila serrata]
MIPETNPEVLEADEVPESINIMGPIEEAHVFEGFDHINDDEANEDDDNDDGVDDGNDFIVRFVVDDEDEDEDDEDFYPFAYSDLLLFVYQAFFQ